MPAFSCASCARVTPMAAVETVEVGFECGALLDDFRVAAAVAGRDPHLRAADAASEIRMRAGH